MLINPCCGNGQGEDHAHVEAPVAAVLLQVLPWRCSLTTLEELRLAGVMLTQGLGIRRLASLLRTLLFWPADSEIQRLGEHPAVPGADGPLSVVVPSDWRSTNPEAGEAQSSPRVIQVCSPSASFTLIQSVWRGGASP